MSNGPLLHRLDSAIKSSPYVLRRHVFLESHQGRIILRGRVDSFYQKQMAQEALRSVDGISEIDNLLEVDDIAIR